jgi:hypothetical protein
MSYTDSNNIIINKISKSQYDLLVSNGTITSEMISSQVWLFTDDQFVSVDNITKLAGIEAGAQVNIIEGVSVNGVTAGVVGKVVNIVVPTKTSDLTNDSGFISNTVDNLVNYYTKNEVTSLINGISSLSMQVVSALPTSGISTTTIYLVLKSVGLESNIYNEYIYVNNTWELIGDTQVDLTNYALKSEIPTKLSDLEQDLDLSQYENVITGIKVNGTDVAIGTDKKVDITIPQCEAGAEINKIETVKVNGVALTPDDSKAVNVEVPIAKTRIWS